MLIWPFDQAKHSDKDTQMPMWCFDNVRPGEMERNPVSEEFFASGTRLEAVIRESLQNSLDATDGGDVPVEVRIYFSGEDDKLPPEKLKHYFNKGERFIDPKNGLVSPEIVMSEDCRFLVIEDFNTTGLTGATDARPLEENVDNRNEWNYYNYFFRENGSTKLGAGTLGSWGAGKCVFQRASRLKCSFTYSVRDNYEPRAFLVGKATLKYHTDADHCTWKPDGWFGVEGDDDPLKMHKLPITDAAFIAKFREDFSITRKDEPGTSVVIPYINLSEGSENEGAEFNQHNLVKSVLRNFLVAINDGKLKVCIKVGKNGHEIVIDKSHIRDYYYVLPNPEDRDALVTQLHHNLILESMELPETQKFTLTSPGEYPQWCKAMFSDDQLKSMRKLLQEEKKSCSITVPIPIRKKTADGKIQLEEGRFIVLLKRQALPKSLPPVFYRVGLLIDDVATEKFNSYIAAVLIDQGVLANLLVAAEPPSHNKWNCATDRVAREYDKPRNHIVYVSHAVREIVNTLASFDQERNYDPLSDVFGIKKARPNARNNAGSAVDNSNSGDDVGNVEPPSPEKRIVAISEIDGNEKGIRARAGEGLLNLPDDKFPFRATFFVGYDTFRGLDWSPNDFMLDNSGSGGVTLSVTEGTVEVQGQGNKVILTIKDKTPFCVTLKGFDQNRDVIAEKLRYDYRREEAEDGVSV